MINNIKLRAVCCLFAAALLGMSACSSVKQESGSQSTETQSSATETAEILTTVPEDSLEKADYEGYIFRILTCDDVWKEYDYIVPEEQNGDIVNDAMYNRIIRVSEALNVDFTEQRDGVAGKVKNAVTAGDDAYDIAYLSAAEANALSLQNMLLDLGEIPTVDLGRSWWMSDYNDYVNITDKIYVAYCDLDLGYVGSYFVTAFNTELVTNYNLDDPYELFENGSWTLDKMLSMMRQVSTDVDGNGSVSDYDTDIFGVVGHSNQLRHLIMASGLSLADDSDGSFKLDLTEKYVDVYHKVNEIAADPSAYFSGVVKVKDSEDYWGIFNSGRVLFHTNTTAAFKSARDADVSYGIIPFPKYDEQQSEYYSVIYSGTQGLTVPVTCSDAERTGLIIEWLNACSTGTLKSAFIESTLYYKYARDEKSVSILENLYSNPTFCDIAFLYDWGGITGKIETMEKKNTQDIASEIAKIESKFNEDIAKTLGE